MQDSDYRLLYNKKKKNLFKLNVCNLINVSFIENDEFHNLLL